MNHIKHYETILNDGNHIKPDSTEASDFGGRILFFQAQVRKRISHAGRISNKAGILQC